MPLSLLNNNRLQYNLTRAFSEIFLVIIFMEINYLSIREGFQYKKRKKSFISILDRKKVRSVRFIWFAREPSYPLCSVFNTEKMT
jgi:hypothetical protein